MRSNTAVLARGCPCESFYEQKVYVKFSKLSDKCPGTNQKNLRKRWGITETKEVHFLYQCTKDELCKMNYASSNAISQRTFIKSDMQRELVDALISMSVLGEIESPDNHSPVEMQMSE